MGTRVVIGTAGHIDHGKSALVEALTGVDPDRLPEEKRRGITVELGFSHLRLDSELVAGVVDVPGHERFVRTMVAGAGGIDLALLVIAADEGVMPQTREHLDVLSLLGVTRGMIALTKSDLLPGLEPGWLELVRSEVRESVRGSFLEEAPILPVSAHTGDGLDALVAELARIAGQVEARPADGPAFLPIDRVFSLSGFGTVVTGTLRSGSFRLGDSVELLPRRGSRHPRIRGIQVHGEAREQVFAGERAALNLAGLDKSSLHRGEVVALPGASAESRIFDVWLDYLPAANRPLKSKQGFHLHLGCALAEAELVLLGQDTLPPGAGGPAQLLCDRPLAALPGQPFILRGSEALSGRGRTLAGGRVLALERVRRRRKSENADDTLKAFQTLDRGSLEARIALLAERAGAEGLLEADLVWRTGASHAAVGRCVQLLLSRGLLLLAELEPRRLHHRSALDALEQRTRVGLQRFHAREPLAQSVALASLLGSSGATLSPKLQKRLLERLQLADDLIVDRDRLSLRAKQENAQARHGLNLKVLDLLRAEGLHPPRVKVLATTLKLPPAELGTLLTQLCDSGELLRVAHDLYFYAPAVQALRSQLLTHLELNGEISTADFKSMTGVSRKHAIPLAEYFDNIHLTLRVGERRVRRGAKAS